MSSSRPQIPSNPWQAPATGQTQRQPVQAATPLNQTRRFLLAAAALAGLLLGGILGLLATQLLADVADLLLRSGSPHAASPGMAVVILLTLPLTLSGSIGGAWLSIRLTRRMLLRQPAPPSQPNS